MKFGLIRNRSAVQCFIEDSVAEQNRNSHIFIYSNIDTYIYIHIYIYIYKYVWTCKQVVRFDCACAALSHCLLADAKLPPVGGVRIVTSSCMSSLFYLGRLPRLFHFRDDLSLCAHAHAPLISIAVAAAKWFDMDWEPFTNMSFLV
jgi:hypothetical protein